MKKRPLFSIINRAVLAVLLLVSFVYAGPQNTSSTAATTIITRARQILNEDTAGFWTDTELLRWVNDGQADIANKAHCIQTSETISLVASTIEYTPTISYIKVIDVWFTDSGGDIWALKNVDPGAKGNAREELYSQSSTPKCWYEFDGKIGIFPAMDTVTTESIKVFYAQQSTDVTASENVGVPSIFDASLVNYVVAMAHQKDRKYNDFQFFWQRYENELNRYRKDLIEQPIKAEPIVD